MKRKNEEKKNTNKKGHHEYPLPGEISAAQKRLNTNAHLEAEKDMTNDAEFVAPTKNDDLDEGETARLGEDKTDLI
jgi:hypothetical protein